MPSIRRQSFKPYLFIAPALLLFVTFSVYPFFLLTATSFLNWDGIFPKNPFETPPAYLQQFVGLQNYVEVFRSDGVFWTSFWQAGYVTLLALLFQNALALLLAIAVNRKLPGAAVYRTIFFLPPILSEIVVGLIWFWIYDGNFGIFNELLTRMGLGAWTRPWLADPRTALTAVAIIHMWKGFGWGFVMFLAGLQTIPEQLYEAARVDGANAWYRFRHITLPLLMPVCVVVSILTILGTMQIFALIIATTGGGPGYHTEVPITRIFQSMLGSSRFGYACAQGIVFGLILLTFSLIQMRFQKRAA
ncbi:MAG: sugar ABC transporter permease [Candidatus Omnitrophica bacterium]|nr:sugar ABC transporter permease [Candidatus Omnitrophota bacterium]